MVSLTILQVCQIILHALPSVVVLRAQGLRARVSGDALSFLEYDTVIHTHTVYSLIPSHHRLNLLEALPLRLGHRPMYKDEGDDTHEAEESKERRLADRLDQRAIQQRRRQVERKVGADRDADRACARV